MFDLVKDYAGWIVAVVGAVTTLAVVLVKGSRRAANVFEKVNQVSEVLLGREAIVHPETGEILAPSSPGIGTRMAMMEQWQAEAGAILLRLADTNAHIAHLTLRLDQLSEKLNRLGDPDEE